MNQYPNQPQQPYGGQMPPSQPLQQGYAQSGPNPPTMPPSPPAKKSKTGVWIVALIIVAAIAFGSGRASVGSSAPVASTTQAAATAPASQPTSAPVQPTATSTKAKGPATLFSLSGNGETTTQPFVAPATWTLSWTCTPDPVLGASGAPLYINIVQGGQDTLDGGVSATCKAGNVSGSSAESTAGQVSLHIISGIDWTVKATA